MSFSAAWQAGAVQWDGGIWLVNDDQFSPVTPMIASPSQTTAVRSQQ